MLQLPAHQIKVCTSIPKLMHTALQVCPSTTYMSTSNPAEGEDLVLTACILWGLMGILCILGL